MPPYRLVRPPHRYLDTYRLIRWLNANQDGIADQAAANSPFRIYVHDHDAHNQPRLHIGVDCKRRTALYRITRLKSGQVAIQSNDAEHRDPLGIPIVHHWPALQDMARNHASAVIAEALQAQFGPDAPPLTLQCIDYQNDVRNFRQVIEAIEKRLTRLYEAQPGVVATAPHLGATAVNHAVRKHISPDWAEKLQDLPTPKERSPRTLTELSAGRYTYADYNFAQRYGAACAAAPPELRNAALYLRSLAKTDGPKLPRRIATPARLVRVVRQHLAPDSPAQWRAFLQLDPNDILCYNSYANDRQRIRSAIALIAAANPARGLDNTGRLAGISRLPQDFVQFLQTNAKAAAGWANITRIYLEQPPNPEITPEQDTVQIRKEYRDLHDAYLKTLQNGEPWPYSPAWKQHTARSVRRHQEWFAAAELRQQALVANARWDSPVDYYHDPQRKAAVNAVTNGPDCVAMGQHFKNCAGTYWQRCANGTTLLFTITTDAEPEQPAYLFSLTQNTDRRWQLGEIANKVLYQTRPAWVGQLAAEIRRQCNGDPPAHARRRPAA